MFGIYKLQDHKQSNVKCDAINNHNKEKKMNKVSRQIYCPGSVVFHPSSHFSTHFKQMNNLHGALFQNGSYKNSEGRLGGIVGNKSFSFCSLIESSLHQNFSLLLL